MSSSPAARRSSTATAATSTRYGCSWNERPGTSAGRRSASTRLWLGRGPPLSRPQRGAADVRAAHRRRARHLAPSADERGLRDPCEVAARTGDDALLGSAVLVAH